MQPTHDSLCSFPPEGEVSSFGRPGGTETKRPPDSLRSFPPEGEVSSFGRPGGTDTDAPDLPDVLGRSDLFADAGPAGAPPVADGTPAVERLAAFLRRRYPERIVAEWVQPARPARMAPLPDGLDRRLVAALHGRGITRLYSHQAQALDLALAGRHVVVATPTASGKSLCYHLPVLQGLLADGARALYLFPTKDLAQDQLAELLAFNLDSSVEP